MGAKPKKDEITFNYPIPRTLHAEVKKLSVLEGMSVKDIMIQALTDFVNKHEGE